MIGNTVEVFHDQCRLLENIGIDFLNRIVQKCSALVKRNLVGIVDMSFAARNSYNIISVDMDQSCWETEFDFEVVGDYVPPTPEPTPTPTPEPTPGNNEGGEDNG